MVYSRIFFLTALVFVFVNDTFGQEETQCHGEQLKFTDHQKAQIAECLDLVGIKSVWKIPPEKIPCFGSCILEKKGMMTPDGKINHEKALQYIDAVMPDAYKKPLLEGVDKCIKDHGDKVKADKDPTCITFMEVGNCVHEVFLEVCVG